MLNTINLGGGKTVEVNVIFNHVKKCHVAWFADDDDQDDDCRYGYGETENEAINDLIEL